MSSSIQNQKILMIAATPFFSDRGCHVRIYNEMKYLKKEGFDVTLCTYHLGKDIEGLTVKRTITVPWYKKITPGASWHKLYIDFFLLVLSFKEYVRIRPKVIHTHLYEGLLIAFVVKIFALGRPKIIFDCQGSLAEEMMAYTLHKSSLFKPFYYIFVGIEKLLLSIPNKTLCSSQNSYDFLISKYHIPKEKIAILPDAVDEELFQNVSEEKKQHLKNTLDIPKEHTVIIYSGSLTKAKGVKELLDALPDILSKNNKLTFLFAGYGDLQEPYEKKYADFITSKNIMFTGRVSYFDLPLFLSVADYAIDPKKDSSESSGKLYNYIAAGLPVICFKNEFNFSVFGQEGIYISNFGEITGLQIKERNVVSKKVNSWNSIVSILVRTYQNYE